AAFPNPPGCVGCGVALNITRDPAIIESGGTVNYTIRIGNNVSGSCNIVNATVTLFCPGPTGQPTVPIVITNGLNMVAGTEPFVLATVPCVVTTSPGVLTAQARVEVTGAAGSCQLSAIDEASGSATATVAVRHS